MKRFRWIVAIVLASSPLARAQPTTRPGAEGPQPRMGPRRGPMSAEDRLKAIEFVQTNMPNLLVMIEDAPKDSLRQRRLTGVAFERYRRSERMQKEHPELYDSWLARIRSEDEVFDLTRRLEQAPEDQKSELRTQLRVKMQEIVLGWMQDRELRIQELRKQLEREEQQLQHDREEIDRLANRHAEMLMGEIRDQSMSPPDLPDGLSPATEPSERARRRDHR